MTIAQQILDSYPAVNEAQRSVVEHVEGPLLVIAGPGSGKTFSLVLRAMNLLLTDRARRSEVMVCTFAEKAAYELNDRLATTAADLGYTGDLSEVKVGTIHGLCNQILQEHRHRTPLGNAYETLDELTGLLFIFEHFQEILGQDAESPYLGKWSTKWRAIKGLRSYFDKITEELVDPADLRRSGNGFVRELGDAYQRYEQVLFRENRVDFAHLQKLVYELLEDDASRDYFESSMAG